METTSTQAVRKIGACYISILMPLSLFQSASKVSLLTIGMQAIMDSYLSLLHLTAGIIVGEISSSTSIFFFQIFILILPFPLPKSLQNLCSIPMQRRPSSSLSYSPYSRCGIFYLFSKLEIHKLLPPVGG